MLANEILDARRIGALVDEGARVTCAVDSEETIVAAVRGGVREVVVDVFVGMPRCGCSPQHAGRLADLARAQGLGVRGVIGYEGHAQLRPSAGERARLTEEAMRILLAAAADVGGDPVTGGGTGTAACNTWADEIQAGSSCLRDTAYKALGLLTSSRCGSGDRVEVIPSHVEPTVALHEARYLLRGGEVLERWEVDLRGW